MVTNEVSSPEGAQRTHNLSAIYPNPFNPTANFTLELTKQQRVRLSVLDALGRDVEMLFNGPLSAGREYSFTIDGTGSPSGVYLVRVAGEQFNDVKRVTVLE